MFTKLSAFTACLVLLALPAAAEARTFKPIGSDQFQLKKQGLGKGAYKKVRQLQKAYPKVGINGLMSDLNRNTGGLLSGDVPGGSFGYSWEDGDNDVSYWYPQGLTGQAGIQAVSWHYEDDRDVRIGFVGRDRRQYRFALLVDPAGGTSFNRVPIHAGGIAWAGKYMYVADTNNGFRVFDTTRILRVPDNRLSGTGNYRYLLPQVGAYKTVGTGFIFSAAALDRSNAGKPALVAGEYRTEGTTRIARWQINPKTNLIARGKATQAYSTTFDQLQGVITHKGRIFVSSSQGPTGRLYFGKPRKKARNKKWGSTPQALFVSGGALWSHTEPREHRTVFAKRFGTL